MSIIRKGLITTAGKGVAVAILFTNGILLARWLHVAGTGQSQLVMLFNLLLGAVCSLGIGQASIYFINNRRIPINVVTVHLMWIAFTWYPLYGLLLWALYLLMPDFFGNLPAVVTFVSCMGAALTLIASMVTPILLAEFRAADSARLEVVQAVALTFATIALATLGRLTVHTAVTTPAFAAAVGVVTALWLVRGHLDRSIRPTWALTRQIIAYGFTFAAMNVALNAHMFAPMILLRYLLKPDFHELGLYRQAASLCGFVALVGTAASPLLYSRWAAEGAFEERARQVEITTRVYALIGFSIAAVMAVLAYWFLRIPYGAEFTPAVPVLRILAFSTAVQLLANALHQLFPAIGRPLVGAALFGGSFLINVALCGLLIPRWGALGAAIAMTTASVAFLAGATWMARRLCGVRLSNCFIPRRDDVRRLIGALRRRRPPAEGSGSV